MQSSVLTYEELRKRYTTAIDALYEIAGEYYTLGRLSDARHLLQTSLHLAEANEVQAQDRLKLLLLYGKVLIVDHLLTRGDGDSISMFAIIQQAKQLAEELQDQQGITDALSLLGQAHYFATLTARLKSSGSPDSPQDQGQYAEALAYQQKALELREALHDTRGVSESHFQIGVIYERWQQYEQALEHYVQARQIADQYRHLFEKTEPARHLALYALRQGNLDQALTYALQALSLREEARFKPYLPLDHLLLRSIYLAKGDVVNSEIHTKQAAVLAEEMGYTGLVSSSPTHLIDNLAAQKEGAQAKMTD